VPHVAAQIGRQSASVVARSPGRNFSNTER